DRFGLAFPDWCRPGRLPARSRCGDEGQEPMHVSPKAMTKPPYAHSLKGARNPVRPLVSVPAECPRTTARLEARRRPDRRLTGVVRWFLPTIPGRFSCRLSTPNW